MPTKKRGDRKHASPEKNRAQIPTKEHASPRKPIRTVTPTGRDASGPRVTTLATAGKKKRPK